MNGAGNPSAPTLTTRVSPQIKSRFVENKDVDASGSRVGTLNGSVRVDGVEVVKSEIAVWP